MIKKKVAIIATAILLIFALIIWAMYWNDNLRENSVGCYGNEYRVSVRSKDNLLGGPAAKDYECIKPDNSGSICPTSMKIGNYEGPDGENGTCYKGNQQPTRS